MPPRKETMDFTKVFFFVVLIEAVTQSLKLLYDSQTHKLNADILVSLILGIGSCVAFNVDIFKMASFEALWHPLGSIFTGVIVSRGANFVHDLLNIINTKANG